MHQKQVPFLDLISPFESAHAGHDHLHLAVGRNTRKIGRQHPIYAGIGRIRTELQTEGIRAAGRLHRIGQIIHRSILIGLNDHHHLRPVRLGEFFAFGGDKPLQFPGRHGAAVEGDLSAGTDMDRRNVTVRGAGRHRGFGGSDGKAAKQQHQGHYGEGRAEPQHGETALFKLGHHGKSFFGE